MAALPSMDRKTVLHGLLTERFLRFSKAKHHKVLLTPVYSSNTKREATTSSGGETKMDTTTGSRTEARKEDPGWLGIEEATPFTGKKVTKAAADAKRWSSVVNATLVVLIMTMPPIIFFAGRLGPPTVWIKSTMSSTVSSFGTRDREGNFQSFAALFCILSKRTRYLNPLEPN